MTPARVAAKETSSSCAGILVPRVLSSYSVESFPVLEHGISDSVCSICKNSLESDNDVDQLDNESDSDEEPKKVCRH